MASSLHSLADYVIPCTADWQAMLTLSEGVRQCHHCEHKVVAIRGMLDFIEAVRTDTCVAVERGLTIGPIPLDGLDEWVPTTRGVLYDPSKKDGEFNE